MRGSTTSVQFIKHGRRDRQTVSQHHYYILGCGSFCSSSSLLTTTTGRTTSNLLMKCCRVFPGWPLQRGSVWPTQFGFFAAQFTLSSNPLANFVCRTGQEYINFKYTGSYVGGNMRGNCILIKSY